MFAGLSLCLCMWVSVLTIIVRQPNLHVCPTNICCLLQSVHGARPNSFKCCYIHNRKGGKLYHRVLSFSRSYNYVYVSINSSCTSAAHSMYTHSFTYLLVSTHSPHTIVCPEGCHPRELAGHTAASRSESAVCWLQSTTPARKPH